MRVVTSHYMSYTDKFQSFTKSKIVYELKFNVNNYSACIIKFSISYVFNYIAAGPIIKYHHLIDTKMASTTKTSPKKHLIINAFAMGCSGLQSQGLWKYPDDRSRYYKDIDYWVDLAKLLDNGKFNSVFLADVLGKLTHLQHEIINIDNHKWFSFMCIFNFWCQ